MGIVYLGHSSWYLSTTKTKDIRQIQNQAIIIAHDLWNLNNFGMQAYLDLVAETNHYNTLDFLTNGGETFLKFSGPEQDSIDSILLQIGLITLGQISFPVIYEKQEIGRSGTGLRLTVVWNTMQDHDGDIRVISTGWVG